NFYRRERPMASPAALRSDRAEGAGVGTGRRDGLARSNGLWREQPPAHSQNFASLDGSADGDRDCRYRRKDTEPVAAPGRDGSGGIGDTRRCPGAEIPCESGKAPDLTPPVQREAREAGAGEVISDRLWCICFMARRRSPRLNWATWRLT